MQNKTISQLIDEYKEQIELIDCKIKKLKTSDDFDSSKKTNTLKAMKSDLECKRSITGCL